MGLSGVFDLPNDRLEIDVPSETLITDAAEQAGILLNTSCAGVGTCGGCAVDLLDGRFGTGNGEIVATGDAPRRVLGCQTRILTDGWRIAVPRRSLIETGEKVVVDYDLDDVIEVRPTQLKVALELPRPDMQDAAPDLERLLRVMYESQTVAGRIHTRLSVLHKLPHALREGDYRVTATLVLREAEWDLIDVEPGDQSGDAFGLAVDIGTTTVVCSLVELNTGRIVRSASCYNQQVQRADDVASRIVEAAADGGIEALRALVVDHTINRLIRLLCREHGLESSKLTRCVVSGNTVMSHLLLGLDPSNMGGIPFQPVASRPGTFRGSEIGLAINPDGLVDVVPAISAYVGGDITSDIVVSGVLRRGERSAILDIGTNGEIALCDRGKILATATAAGPAFEGGRIGCGMRASVGAIERVRIDAETLLPEVMVIGDVPAVGICGSGLIDVLAHARRTGLMDETGRFDRGKLDACERLREIDTGQGTCLGYVLVPAEQTEDGVSAIVIDERDVATLLQAKAAMYSGLSILLREAGLTLDELDRFYLAGGFAKHIDLGGAITIGLLPDLPLDRFRVIGNGSLAGAVLGLVDREAWAVFDRIATTPRTVELNLVPEFQDEYVSAMFLPHMEPERFPTVAAGGMW